MASLFSIESVSKHFDNEKSALEPISLTIEPQDRLGIVGETGSGKSTLLKIMAGLVQTDSGKVLFTNEKVIGPEDKLLPGHKDIAYLSQHFELPKFISVFEHLDDSYLIAPDDAKKIYAACQIDHLIERDTRALSGGEKQRVALAKLLLSSPKTLLLDEPFSNLDFIHKGVIKEVIDSVEKELNITVIMVAHDPHDVLSWASRIMVFRQGEMIQETEPSIIYSLPQDTYVAGLFGTFSLLTPSDWGISSHQSFTQIGEKSLVRPERIQVNEKDGIRGEVLSIRYFGAYDEVLIKTTNDEVVIQTEVGRLKIGESVELGMVPLD